MQPLLSWNESYGHLVWPLVVLLGGLGGALALRLIVRRAHRPWHWLAGLGLGAGLVLGLLGWLGHGSLERTRRALAEQRTFRAGPIERRYPVRARSDEAFWATLSPFQRDDVLWRLTRAQRDHGPPSARGFERLIALHLAQDDCGRAAEAAIEHGQAERALALAAECEQEYAAAQAIAANCALGRYRAARALYRDDGWLDLSDAQLQLLAGDWRTAAEMVEKLAAMERDNRPQVERIYAQQGREAPEPTKLHGLDCLAAALAAGAGDDGAQRRLRRLAQRTPTASCRLLAADRAAGEERLALLAGLLAPERNDEFGRMAALLAIEAGRLELPDALLDQGWDHALLRAALARAEGLDGERAAAVQAWLHAALARARLDAGALDAAAAELDAVAKRLGEQPPPRRLQHKLLGLRGELALSRGRPDRAAALLAELDASRLSLARKQHLALVTAAARARRSPGEAPDGQSAEAPDEALRRPVERLIRQRPLLRVARSGDGARLALALWAERFSPFKLPLHHLLALIDRDREVLAESLHFSRRLWGKTCDAFDMRDELAAERAMAAACQHGDWLRTVDGQLEALRQLLADRERIVPLFVLAGVHHVL
jgi:hypothetical protein